MNGPRDTDAMNGGQRVPRIPALQALIERNRGWLRLYSTLARGIGWALILLGILTFAFFYGPRPPMPPAHAQAYAPATSLPPPPPVKVIMKSVPVPSYLTGMLLPGILAILTAQLLRYLLDDDKRPGWLLRHGEAILYLYAGIVLLETVRTALDTNYSFASVVGAREFGQILSALRGYALEVTPRILLGGAKILIFVGLAQALCRTLPIIEESKTLV